eukprot:gnl/MRDRNA2_/MRDRNA2_26640_c0_seq1.p1 gnl/MRDRNA2_/MRDRNA2_26640_c0~~gnl/MRDRNA2_/MRDRNA2_26640_c0_seq1.p1  ORF type:complete len:203 (+),score=32.26 gnl/MRDRNA2_/MRDRNA2_26640_c0_seq1:2-610(+)
MDGLIEHANNRSKGPILRQLANAEAKGVVASYEPRCWRTPWRSELFINTVRIAFKLRIYLGVMERTIIEIANDSCQKYDAIQKWMASQPFQQVRADLLAKIDLLKTLFGVFMHEVDREPELHLKFAQELRLEVEREHVKDLVKATSHMRLERQLSGLHSPSKGTKDMITLENDIPFKISTIIVALDATFHDLSSLKHLILST